MGTTNDEIICRMRDLALDGVHPDEIAQQTGVCRKTVTKYVGDACRVMRRGIGKSSLEEVHRARQYVHAGANTATLARMMYMSEYRAKQLMICAKEWGRRRSRASLILRNRFESHEFRRHPLNQTIHEQNRRLVLERLGDILVNALRKVGTGAIPNSSGAWERIQRRFRTS